MDSNRTQRNTQWKVRMTKVRLSSFPTIRFGYDDLTSSNHANLIPDWWIHDISSLDFHMWICARARVCTYTLILAIKKTTFTSIGKSKWTFLDWLLIWWRSHGIWWNVTIKTYIIVIYFNQRKMHKKVRNLLRIQSLVYKIFKKMIT